ncbi:hypothetical protein [uncultured Methanosphaera sp.]|uniref:hypothetical protein n=1 Tax=uncultured Methanosphaera sp. TaxID=262501 RepID=UPI002805A1F1|nr:hypothetical protein [uncultured Methanosphaera sp.]
MVSSQYNKNWLKLKQRFHIPLKGISLAAGAGGVTIAILELSLPELSFSNPITAIIGIAIGTYGVIEDGHSFFIDVREDQDPSEWGNSNNFIHKNFLEDYDYVEIMNASNPNYKDIIEIPYTKNGYDRENALYIPYEGEPRKMSVEETKKNISQKIYKRGVMNVH